MTKQNTTYGSIFKTTFLFGFVQVFKAVISIVKNKLVAMLIGAEGMGLLGIFNSTLQLIQSGAGLGINQSAVRDVAEANGDGDKNRIARIVSVTNKVVLFTGLLGCLITLALSKWLSVWTLGETGYTISYCILGIAVALNIMNDGKQALLKGMRHLRSLANASMIGTSVGLLTAVPLYYFFGKDGIVPELLIASTLALLVSQLYVRKIPVEKAGLSLGEVFYEAKPMIRIGVALMFISFLQYFVLLIINSFIRSHGGLTDVGYYSAGSTLIHSCFGVIITALMTDYYPRIASVNNNNAKLQDELNKQSQVSLVLCCPMFVLFMVFLSFFIKLLYTPEFVVATDFVQYAIYWTLITICSNQVDMILVAKGDVKIFTTIAVIVRVVQLLLCLLLYSTIGLKGLGIAYAILGVLHMSIMTIVVYKKYGIRFNSLFVRLSSVVLVICLLASACSCIEALSVKYILGTCLFIISCFFSLTVSRKYLEIDIVKVIRNKFSNK